VNLILDNFAQTAKPLLFRVNTRVLAEGEILQAVQVPADIIRQEASGRQKPPE
jgi:hypothetical protein